MSEAIQGETSHTQPVASERRTLEKSGSGFLRFREGIRLTRRQGERGINARGTPLAFMPRKPLDAWASASHFGQLVGMAFSSPPAASRRVRGLGQSPRTDPLRVAASAP